MKYYESCKMVSEQEKNVCKTFSGKIISTDDEINNAHDNLLKYRSQSDNLAQMYKYEISKVNKIFEDNEKKYHLVFEKLKTNEESRIFFIKCSMEKFSKIYEEFAMSSFDFLNRLNTTLVEIKVEEDIKFFNEKFKLKENCQRLSREEFISYDTYKKNIESPMFLRDEQGNIIQNNISQQTTQTYTTLSHLGTPSSHSMDTVSYFSNPSSPRKLDTQPEVVFNINTLSDDYELISESQFYSEKYQQSLIDEFLSQLFSDNEIQADSMSRFMEVLYNNSYFSKNFIDSILRDRRNIYIKLANFNNLQHFANILNAISINLDNVQNENYDLNFAIIFIAERTFCYYKKESEKNLIKVYLSALLSKNKLYATRSFWIELIELKLNRRIEEQLNRIDRNLASEKIISSPIASNTNRDKIDINLFTNIGAKLKNIFNSNAKDKEEITNFTSRNFIKNMESPNYNPNKKLLIEKITTTEVCSIIKEYIPHFANFNFDISEAIDMIVELSSKYKVVKEKISYFVTYLNSCVFTIKNKLPNSKEDIERKKSKNNSHLAKTNDYKITILSSSIKYLNISEFINLLLVNKNCNSKIGKKVYKHFLSNKKGFGSRLEIWKCILKIKDLKKKYCYEQILEDIKERKINNDKSVISFSDMIELDVQRTFFEENVDESRIAIGNILKGIAYVNPKINYCQGMNYIASFLFKITSSESEAFYLMLGLFEQTDFSLIFIEDLLRLKIFFYVFERLLSLYLPELYSYFKSNSINVNYFCSPWFITLFTNTSTFSSLTEPPEVLLRIWDDFLLNGWIGLMRTSLYLLKTYESMLITLKYEDLLHFLINEMTRTGFFLNSNLNEYSNLLKTTKLKTELINNLENEYIQGIKIKDIEEKNKNVVASNNSNSISSSESK